MCWKVSCIQTFWNVNLGISQCLSVFGKRKINCSEDEINETKKDEKIVNISNIIFNASPRISGTFLGQTSLSMTESLFCMIKLCIWQLLAACLAEIEKDLGLWYSSTILWPYSFITRYFYSLFDIPTCYLLLQLATFGFFYFLT